MNALERGCTLPPLADYVKLPEAARDNFASALSRLRRIAPAMSGQVVTRDFVWTVLNDLDAVQAHLKAASDAMPMVEP